MRLVFFAASVIALTAAKPSARRRRAPPSLSPTKKFMSRGGATSRKTMARFALTYAIYCLVYLERKPVSLTKTMLSDDLGLDTTQLAWLDSSWLVSYAIGQLSLGTARSFFSPLALVAGSLVFSGASTFACGRAHSFEAMASCWGLNGFFQSAINPLLVLYVAGLFPASSRASAVGTWQTSQQVGGVLANLFAARILRSTGSWRPMFFSAGAVVAASALPLVLFTKERSAPSSIESTRKTSSPKASRRKQQVSPIRLKGVPYAAGAYFLVKMTRYSLMFWLPYFLANAAGLDAARAANLASLFDVGGAFGALSAGFVADDLFGGAMLAASAPFAAATAVVLVAFATFYRLGPLACAACMLGVGFCVAAPDGVLGGAAARNLCDYNDITDDPDRAAAAVSGFVNGCGSLGAILQGICTAALVDKFGWSSLFYSLAASMALASLLLVPAIRLERASLQRQ